MNRLNFSNYFKILLDLHNFKVTWVSWKVLYCTAKGMVSSKAKFNYKTEVMSFSVIYFISRQHFRFLRIGSLNICGHCLVLNDNNKLYFSLCWSYLISTIIKWPNFQTFWSLALILKWYFYPVFSIDILVWLSIWLFHFFFCNEIMFPWQPK